MYQECLKNGMGIVSVGHRPSLLEYHNLLLVLDGNGGWELLSSEDDM